MNDARTLGQRWADTVTEFSGSWPFIIWFVVLCVLWIGFNLVDSLKFDPYPFLFLNWILTVVSTLQNPLIMLSNHRQNEMDQAKTDAILRELSEVKSMLRELQDGRVVQAKS